MSNQHDEQPWKTVTRGQLDRFREVATAGPLPPGLADAASKVLEQTDGISYSMEVDTQSGQTTLTPSAQAEPGLRVTDGRGRSGKVHSNDGSTVTVLIDNEWGPIPPYSVEVQTEDFEAEWTTIITLSTPEDKRRLAHYKNMAAEATPPEFETWGPPIDQRRLPFSEQTKRRIAEGIKKYCAEQSIPVTVTLETTYTDSDPRETETNAERIKRTLETEYWGEDLPDVITMALADLRELCDARDLDFTVLDRAGRSLYVLAVECRVRRRTRTREKGGPKT